jgi:hypothetical protein
MMVHVPHYSHKYGDDISVYETKEAAIDNAFDIMKEYISDFKESIRKGTCPWDYAKLLRAMRKKNLVEACKVWNEYMEESFEILEKFVFRLGDKKSD